MANGGNGLCLLFFFIVWVKLLLYSDVGMGYSNRNFVCSDRHLQICMSNWSLRLKTTDESMWSQSIMANGGNGLCLLFFFFTL